LLLHAWVSAGHSDEARALLNRIEASLPPPPSALYLDLAPSLFRWAQIALPFAPPEPSPRKEAGRAFAVEVVQRGALRYPDDAPYHEQAARLLMEHYPAEALELAATAVRLAPESLDAQISLGLLHVLNGHPRLAEQTLRAAAKLARRMGRSDLADAATSFIALAQSPDQLRSALTLARLPSSFPFDPEDDDSEDFDPFSS
jgi:hypothetical protein